MTEENQIEARVNLIKAGFKESILCAAVTGLASTPGVRAEDIAKRALGIANAVIERMARNDLGLP